MVGNTDVEGVVSRRVGSTAAILFQTSPHDPRYLTSPIHWGPPSARLGGIASLGDALGSVWLELV